METTMIIDYNNIIPDPDQFLLTYDHILNNFSDDYIEEEEEESYIEIALEDDDYVDCCSYDDDDDDGMELRISFSSSFHLPYLTSSSNSSSLSPVVVTQPGTHNMHFPAPNCTVESVVNTLTLSSDVDHTHMELLRPTRKNNVPSITMNNGMMMNMFVKFRDLKLIKTFLASLMKVSDSRKYKEKKAKQSQPKRKQQQQTKTILEINLDAIRGVFGRKQTKGSKSFTIHQHQHQPLVSQTYLTCANDNSIQSAIAHCKR